MNLLNGSNFQRLNGAVRAAELRQQVISNNVANADTPYFKRSEVVFEKYLEQEMGKSDGANLPLKRTNPKHLGAGGQTGPLRIGVETDEISVMNNNVNNVDIDREMSLLAKNQLRYNALIHQVSHDIRMIRTAIEGRS
ncbi:flagellar basal body rod protein FlgB [Paenibacillus pinihumi]|uniref:flagellar basal body rod protein FlgB n=1 Tax=Paenibacillus pinihumi TaxID=669462 RepID=UPI000415A7B5|nr:flagellar basal body rod protein FlgB [Paenibacillus pinihumi]